MVVLFLDCKYVTTAKSGRKQFEIDPETPELGTEMNWIC